MPAEVMERGVEATRSDMRSWTQPLCAAVVFLVVFAGSLAPIRSYDFFWHLATGHWIVAHGALPAIDPFAVASSRSPWINGEWLFDVALYALQSTAGFAALSWLRGLLVASLFAAVYLLSGRNGNGPLAFLLTLFAFAGVQGHYEVRPATLAACFVAMAVALLAKRENWPWYLLLSVVWINVHPSALLAPLFAGVRLRWKLAAGSVAALFVNPWGWRAISAPIDLTLLMSRGSFVNSEWRPSGTQQFPMLYLAIAVACLLFATTTCRRDQAWRFAIVAILAFLAVEHVRNQGLFYAVFPLIGVAPQARRWPGLVLVSFIPLLLILGRFDGRTGVDPGRYPIAAVARLRASELKGNVYDADQFGGFLIWSFYPERRVLTDGRNELYENYLAEYAAARLDERRWHALLAKYRITIAVDEYHPEPLDVVDAVTGARRRVPASLVYFPRKEWALISYDRVAMVFARRAAFPPALVERWELRGIVPDQAAAH
jgi:hypothetical protein